MYIVYMAGRPPRQKAKNDARQQLCSAPEGTLHTVNAIVAGALPHVPKVLDSNQTGIEKPGGS